MHTRRETRWRVLALIAVVAGAGCVGEPEDEADDLDRLARELFAASAIANGVPCGDCYDDLPPVSQQACDEIAFRDDQCRIDAYHVDAETSKLHIACILPAERDYATCLEEEVTCGDASTWEECAYALQDELDGCDPFSDDVREAIAACSDAD